MTALAYLAYHNAPAGSFGGNAGLGIAVVAIVFWLLVKSDKVPPGK